MNERIVIHPAKKDSNGKFYVTVSYYFNGIRKQKRKSGFIKSKDAKLEGERIKKKLEEEMPIIKSVERQDTTFKEFAEDYIKIKKSDWSFNTKKIRVSSLDHCDFKDKKLTEIDKMDIAKNVKKLEETYKYNTINSILASWNVFFNAAVEYNYILTAPKYKLIKSDEVIAVENVMSVEDATKLLELIEDKEIYLLTLITMTTGARAGEAVDININDIDFKSGIWDIKHQFKHVDGLGCMHNQKLKTKNSYRKVPLPPMTIKAINDFPFRTIDGFIFGRAPTRVPRNANKIYKSLGAQITLHGFRHTYITNLIRSKQFDLQSIAKLAGDTIETITGTYIHYLREMQEENIEKIKALFG